jgi:hypothetical protein
MKKLKMMLVLSIVLVSSLHAKTVIGTINSGTHKYTVYIGSGNSIYVKSGSTDFANVCDTGLVSKGKYVSTRSGKALYNKDDVLTYIKRLFYRGAISGCK